MAIQSEAELYAPLKKFFEQHGYTVKGEVRNCDLVGIKESDNEPLIVEMKKTFNLALLLQGVERLKMSTCVYLAVEKSRTKKGAVNQRWSELRGLCQRLGLGLITVTFFKTKAPFVEVLCTPSAWADVRRAPKRKDRLLAEFRERSGDYNTGGVTRAKLMTAYREKALRVAAALRQACREEEAAAAEEKTPAAAKRSQKSAPPKPGVSPAALRDRCGVGSAAAILQNNYYGWFLRVSRGRYMLTEAGVQALNEYAAVLESHHDANALSLPLYTGE